MIQEEIIISNTVSFVQKKLQGDSSGHDWWHIQRVWKMALYLAEKEGADTFLVQISALLHDISDWKLNKNNTHDDSEIIGNWLLNQQLNRDIIEKVCDIIADISFKGAGVETPMKTIEGKVVQDADRLDAMGALGIARAFAYGGWKGREMHNPDIEPVMHNSFDDYKKKQSTTINHFYEKLLLLQDRMNTTTARKIAQKRHLYMQDFLIQFRSEWNGEK
jgi:uncharacterized protein